MKFPLPEANFLAASIYRVIGGQILIGIGVAATTPLG